MCRSLMRRCVVRARTLEEAQRGERQALGLLAEQEVQEHRDAGDGQPGEQNRVHRATRVRGLGIW